DADDLTWPAVPLFCECRIDTSSRTLVIDLVDEAQLESAIKGQVDFAVMGGIDAIFYDPWIRRSPELQARLLDVVEKQLRALATCGVRIGVELSGVPSREFAHFVRRLCAQDVIIAIGINGVDELPSVVGRPSLEKQLYEFWLDPQTVPWAVRDEIE